MNLSKMLSLGLLSLLVFQTQCWSWKKSFFYKCYKNNEVGLKVMGGIGFLGLACYSLTKNEPILDTGLSMCGHTLFSNKEVAAGAGLVGLGLFVSAGKRINNRIGTKK